MDTIFFIVATTAVLVGMGGFAMFRKDTTDCYDLKELKITDRSGIAVRTDHATGVQYIVTPFAITPRLTASGTLFTLDMEKELLAAREGK